MTSETKNQNMTTTIEIELDVEYKFHKGGPGARDSLGGKANAGPPLEPDDPGEMEILSIKYAGNDFDLSDEQREKIEAECWEDMEDRRDA